MHVECLVANFPPSDLATVLVLLSVKARALVHIGKPRHFTSGCSGRILSGCGSWTARYSTWFPLVWRVSTQGTFARRALGKVTAGQSFETILVFGLGSTCNKQTPSKIFSYEESADDVVSNLPQLRRCANYFVFMQRPTAGRQPADIFVGEKWLQLVVLFSGWRKMIVTCCSTKKLSMFLKVSGGAIVRRPPGYWPARLNLSFLRRQYSNHHT